MDLTKIDTWTREQLYTPLEKVPSESLKKLKDRVNSCEWRQKFHIQPTTGLLNDPNGFSYYQDEYHLFYQWFPNGAVHGLKYWYHLKSKNLVDWEDLGIALKPDSNCDSHGVYSGSAIEKDEHLYLMYTANHRDKDWNRHPSQALAKMNKVGEIEKLSEPIIKNIPKGFTEHFRDPKVWEKDGKYYVVIGAQRENETGTVVLYQSEDLQLWEYLGELSTHYSKFGYMWECPDYFELDGKGILLVCPQGVVPEGEKYQNIYQSGYFMGDVLQLPNLEWQHKKFLELDHGFDFYAPQTMLDAFGRRLLIGWMGLPDISYPTDINCWAHCLTLPRELIVKNSRIYQKPVPELQELRKNTQEIDLKIKEQILVVGQGTHYELECEFSTINAKEVGLNLRSGKQEKTVIKYDVEMGKVILDRSKSGELFAEEFGTKRVIPFKEKTFKLQIFVDTSSIEIFVNEGEYVMSARIFPTNKENRIEIFARGSCDVKFIKHEV